MLVFLVTLHQILSNVQDQRCLTPVLANLKGYSLYQTFYGCSSFNQPLNDWTVSNVKNMQGLFRQAAAFNQDLDNWVVGFSANLA